MRSELNSLDEALAPAGAEGLTSEQVRSRTEAGQTNSTGDEESTTLGSIIRENVFTYFNLIFVIAAVLLGIVGAWRDISFLPLIIFNTAIGIVQEWAAKVTLDRVSILDRQKTTAIRDSRETEVDSEELVLDDVVLLRSGSQVPADARIVSGEVSVNEAMLTGEAAVVAKKEGDSLYSGSFIVNGACRAILTAVGKDSYAYSVTHQAKLMPKGEQSEMIRALNRLLKIVGVLIIPIGLILFWQQYTKQGLSLRTSVQSTVAAVLGMIPEGLYLLSSVTMAVSVGQLALNKVLVHDMKSIETLARSDVLCVDKTGTITDSTITVSGIVSLKDGMRGEEYYYRGAAEDSQNSPSYNSAVQELERDLSDLSQALTADSETMEAMQKRFAQGTGRRAERVIPFASEYKFSAAVFRDRTNGESGDEASGEFGGGSRYETLIFGAPEFVLRENFDSVKDLAEKYASIGMRVMVFGKIRGAVEDPLAEFPSPVEAKALILAENPVRESAPETFRYFSEQGVAVKVISGDSPQTVSYVAQQAGIRNAQAWVDARELETAEDFDAAVRKYTVFGRVTPEQKRMIVSALQRQGHTVAMTGDGVNDVLALKDADCSIAMRSGSQAAAHTAQMVLLEDDFGKMPFVVSEGRRVVNNIERSASLFLVKNIFSLLMSIFSIVLMVKYPIKPAQLSLVSAFTIGFPGFILSFEPYNKPIRGRFLSNVLYRALPAGITDFAVISFLLLFCREFRVSDPDLSVTCTILLAVVGLMILYRIMRPMNRLHWGVLAGVTAGLLLTAFFLHDLFEVTMPSERGLLLVVLFSLLTEPVMRIFTLVTRLIWKGARYFAAARRPHS